MKLYYFETLNPRKACAVARYLGSPVEFVRIDLAKGEHKRPEFLAINPNGKVPAFTDGDTKLWEADAIMAYLAKVEGSDLLPGRQPPDRDDALAELEQRSISRGTPACCTSSTSSSPASSTARPMRKRSRKRPASSSSLQEVLNDHLRGRKYLLGDTLTIADFSVAVTLPYAEKIKLPLGKLPRNRALACPAQRASRLAPTVPGNEGRGGVTTSAAASGGCWSIPINKRTASGPATASR